MFHDEIPLRPHHGMCLAYFKGEGYSNAFTRHMGEMLHRLEQGAMVRLHCGGDVICTACPHLNRSECTSMNALCYDKGVLQVCGLQEGAVLSFGAFTAQVEERILSKGLRQTICGGCQWNELCSSQKSRWATK